MTVKELKEKLNEYDENLTVELSVGHDYYGANGWRYVIIGRDINHVTEDHGAVIIMGEDT